MLSCSTLTPSTSASHTSTAVPDHRKVRKKRIITFNMDIEFHHCQYYPDERFIANLPWVKALNRRRAGLPSSLDTVTTCHHRAMHKLVSIERDGRSSEESKAWKQVLEHAGKQARVRAVQMHLDCITSLKALPLSLSCCGQKPLLASALRGVHTDKIERER